MKRMLAAMFCSTIAAAAAAGCATPAQIRAGANEHLAKARTAEAEGDYYRADKERAAAQKQFAKANQRAYEQATSPYYW